MAPPQQLSQACKKQHRGPRLPASLHRELQLQKQQESKSHDHKETEAGARLPSDVYEYEENVAPEEVRKNSRYDEVDQLEYQLPSDFEDEEIDEDAASGEDFSDKLGSRNSQKHLKKSSSSGERKNKRKFQPNNEEKIEDDGRHQRMVEAVTRCPKDRHRKKSKDMGTFSQAYPESEFNVNAHTSHQITVEDLMTPLQGTTGFGSLRKRMQQLQKRGAPVNAPLPKVVQERLDRQAGYEKTREEISKWQHIVKRNREAPTLVLTKRRDLLAVSTAELVSKFVPTTKLEKEVASILQEHGFTDESPGVNAQKSSRSVKRKNKRKFQCNNEEKIEDDGRHQRMVEASKMMNKLTVSEVKERQERLSKMRSLLFYHEAKAKRMKKIKSKAFHWLQQKDRKTKLGLNGTKENLDPEEIKEATLKQEFKRAQERMTLKHQNTSKWAKRIIQRGLKAKKDGSRDAIAEQLRIHEEVTRKIHYANNISSSDDSLDEGTESGAGETDNKSSVITKSRPRLLAKFKMETLKVLEGDAEAEIPATGLFSLPFMARAIEKKRKHAHDEALAVLEDLEQFESIDNRADGFQENVDLPQDIGVPSGRLAFGAMAKPLSLRKGTNGDDEFNMRIEDGISSEDGSEDKNIVPAVRKSVTIPKKRKEKDSHSLLSEALENSELEVAERMSSNLGVYLSVEQDGFKGSITNPWLFGELKEQPCVAGHANVVRLPKRDKKEEDSKRFDVQKLSGDNKTQEQKLLEPQVTIAGGENVLLSGVGANVRKTELAKKVDIKKRGKPVGSAKSFDVADTDQPKMLGSGGGSDTDEEHENEGMDKQGFQLMTRNESQAELIQRAFAGDNVEADFEQLKSHALDEEVPVGETPVNLPGWGQWTDVQKKKGQPLWILQQEEELKTKRNLALRKRKDSNLKHVIISEKLDKKAEKFLSSCLPFPYQSQETFERSIRMPIGREFNPDHAFRDMIRPSVVKHAGVVIDPMKYTMSEASNGRDSFPLSRKRRKGGKRGSDSL